jgi:hypothetical protein
MSTVQEREAAREVAQARGKSVAEVERPVRSSIKAHSCMRGWIALLVAIGAGWPSFDDRRDEPAAETQIYTRFLIARSRSRLPRA